MAVEWRIIYFSWQIPKKNYQNYWHALIEHKVWRISKELEKFIFSTPRRMKKSKEQLQVSKLEQKFNNIQNSFVEVKKKFTSKLISLNQNFWSMLMLYLQISHKKSKKSFFYRYKEQVIWCQCKNLCWIWAETNW